MAGRRCRARRARSVDNVVRLQARGRPAPVRREVRVPRRLPCFRPAWHARHLGRCAGGPGRLRGRRRESAGAPGRALRTPAQRGPRRATARAAERGPVHRGGGRPDARRPGGPAPDTDR
ncbi:hypothetical protein B7R87_26960 [Streptomyces tsukubensis]|nr:hypothetical protein B7R87_26960 [Streptomyces tsukubensis]